MIGGRVGMVGLLLVCVLIIFDPLGRVNLLVRVHYAPQRFSQIAFVNEFIQYQTGSKILVRGAFKIQPVDLGRS